MTRSPKGLLILPLTVLGLSVLSGCVDEKIVYRDRDLFEEPLEAAGSFLGYSDEASQLTVCGNCHVEKQGDWIETAHAHAWETLQANPDAQEFCEGCHTVNEFGNTVAEPAGYNQTGEERYHDVQCESCHGPGLTHVSNPLGSNAPLAPVEVGVDLTQGCGECHSGAHHPFADEWAQSRHGTMNPYPQGRSACEGCHTAEGALEIFAPQTEYLEQPIVEDNTSENLPITCAVCHDPHNATHEGQLRFAIDEPDVEKNLCMKCHHKRAEPDLGEAGTSSRGPHSPQGPLLLGEIGTVGWTPPNFPYDVERIRGTHGSERNQRLCATCHVNSYEVNDPESGDHLFSVTGHRFLPIPCVDANDIPTEDQDCARTLSERSFRSCTASGCHGDEDAAFAAYSTARADITARVAELAALLALVPATEFSDQDAVFTVAEGAEFNMELGEIESSAIHNPFMMRALLLASIQAVEDEYFPAVPASPARQDLQALVGLWGN